MAVMRVEKNQNYTTMSNYHLQDTRLTLKAIGLLSKILSLPDDWDYTVAGLASICKEGKDAVRSALEELETAGYIERRQTHAADGSFAGNEYIVYESPADVRSPLSGFPSTDKPSTGNPLTGTPTEQNTNIQNTKRTKTPISPAVMKRLEDYAGDDQELLQRLADFAECRRKARRAISTDRQVTLLLNKLDELSGGKAAVKRSMLDEAVEKGWLSVYAPKADQHPRGQPQRRREEADPWR